ncbi:hypothetical protein MMPV_003444 [Pyropia vietnamensis]
MVVSPPVQSRISSKLMSRRLVQLGVPADRVSSATEAAMTLIAAVESFEATAGGPRLTAQLSSVRHGTDVVWARLYDSLYGSRPTSHVVTTAYSSALRLSWTTAVVEAGKAGAMPRTVPPHANASVVVNAGVVRGAFPTLPVFPDSSVVAAAATAVLPRRIKALKVPRLARSSAIDAAAAVVVAAAALEGVFGGLRVSVQVSSLGSSGNKARGEAVVWARLYDSLHAPGVALAPPVSDAFATALRGTWDEVAPLSVAPSPPALPPPGPSTDAAAASTAVAVSSTPSLGSLTVGTDEWQAHAPVTTFGQEGATHERRRLSFSMSTTGTPTTSAAASVSPHDSTVGGSSADVDVDVGSTAALPVRGKRGRSGLKAGLPLLPYSPLASYEPASAASEDGQPAPRSGPVGGTGGTDGETAARVPSMASLPPPASVALLFPEDVARRLAAFAARGFPPAALARFEAAVRQAAIEHDVTGMVLCCGDVEELARLLTQYYKGGTSAGALCLARSFILRECR